MPEPTPPATPAGPPPTLEPPEHRTYSLWFAVFGIGLVIVSVWAAWDETVKRRPWKVYQKRFFNAAGALMREQLDGASTQASKGRQTKEYQDARRVADEARARYERLTLSDKVHDEIRRALESLGVSVPDRTRADGSARHPVEWLGLAQEAVVRKADGERKKFQAVRGQAQAYLWQWETYRSQRVLGRLVEIEKDIDPATKRLMDLDVLRIAIRDRKNALEATRAVASRQLAAFDADVDDRRRRLEGLEGESIGVRQTYIPALDVVDRCESCHMGIGRAGLESLPQPFRRHSGDWLETHPVEEFGCTPCHRGDGFATASVEKAHGQNRYWLKPMLQGKMVQAACYKCHDAQTNLQGAEVLNEGRRLFKEVGCYACHKMRNFGEDEQQLADVRKDLSEKVRPALEQVRKAYAVAIQKDDARAKLALAPTLNRREAEAAEKEKLLSDVQLELRHIGPDLTAIKTKLRPAWVERWLEDPRAFRPTTRMPRFWPRIHDPQLTEVEHKDRESLGRLERHAIITFLWRNSEGEPPPPAPAPSPTDIQKGKELAEQVGCRGCHNLTAADAKVLPDPRFGPDLSRVGDKAYAAWIAQWVEDPRALQPTTKMPHLRLSKEEARQIAAYLSTLKKEDFEGEPDFLTNTKVADQEGRDLARLAGYGIAGDHTALLAIGRKLVERHGCYSCHLIRDRMPDGKIRDMSTLSKIGTELSQHGSKMVEEFDFGLLEHSLAHEGGGEVWEEYVNAKGLTEGEKKEREDLRRFLFPGGVSRPGWIATKLMSPRVFDRGKRKKPEERLKMPDFGLTPREIFALTTFIVANTDEWGAIPPRLADRPRGHKEAIVEGEKVVAKFNCNGCHRLDAIPSRNQLAAQAVLAQHLAETARGEDEFEGEGEPGAKARGPQGPKAPSRTQMADALSWVMEGQVWHHYSIDDKWLAPPPLTFEGAKVQPGWLFSFLKDPSTLRPRHKIKMPTFGMSDREATTLVRYLAAKDNQPFPYVPPTPPPPDTRILAEGKKAFDENQCIKCHAPGEPGASAEMVKAPDLSLSPQRLRRDWIADWVLEPQRFQPDVIMPAYRDAWKDPSKPDDLGPALSKARALADYLIYQGQAAATAPSPGGGKGE